jgi:hypothetical protein
MGIMLRCRFSNLSRRKLQVNIVVAGLALDRSPPDAFPYAAPQFLSDPMCAYVHSVRPDSQSLAQFPSQGHLLLLIIVIVGKDQFPVLRGKRSHTLFQALAPYFVLLRRRGRRRQLNDRSFAYVFQIDFVGHAAEIRNGIADIAFGDPAGFQGDSIYCLIRQFFRHAATAARENLYEADPYRLILAARSVTVAVQPAEQPVE